MSITTVLRFHHNKLGAKITSVVRYRRKIANIIGQISCNDSKLKVISYNENIVTRIKIPPDLPASI